MSYVMKCYVFITFMSLVPVFLVSWGLTNCASYDTLAKLA